MSVVVMTSDKGKCVGLALVNKNALPMLIRNRNRNARFTKFRAFSKSDVMTVALPHGKLAI
jgi:hypothetical protein